MKTLLLLLLPATTVFANVGTKIEVKGYAFPIQIAECLGAVSQIMDVKIPNLAPFGKS